MKLRHVFTIVSATAVIMVTASACNTLQNTLHFPSNQVLAATPVAYQLAYQPATRSNGNDYPTVLANAAPASLADAYGMKNRSCSSYVLWKVDETYDYTPDMKADNWPLIARNQGIPTGSTPEGGSVVYAAPNVEFGTETANGVTTTYTAGSAGHVMWLNHVNANGTITVSEYNLDNDGDYSVAVFKPTNVTYIYFGDKR
jgi:surface antigen